MDEGGLCPVDRIEQEAALDGIYVFRTSLPSARAISQVVGYIKGKSASHVARTFMERKRSFVGQHFWARVFFVSTVGRDEAVIRDYIRHQEREDKRADQLLLVP